MGQLDIFDWFIFPDWSRAYAENGGNGGLTELAASTASRVLGFGFAGG
jgi:hypothetical protein